MLFVLFPVLYYVLTGERIMIFPVYVPFLDDSNWQGFMTYFAIHTGWCVQIPLGFVASDLLMALLLLHIWPLVEIFELSIKELNYELMNLPAARQSLTVKVQMRNVIQMHKEIFKSVPQIYVFAKIITLFSIYQKVTCKI